MTDASQCYHFVTGRLAEHVVRSTVAKVAESVGFKYSIQVLPITVAALINCRWLMRHLVLPPDATCLILPGYMQSEWHAVSELVDVEVRVGPRDIRDLPLFFGQTRTNEGYGEYDIEILAEINHADRLPEKELVDAALKLSEDGANLIDLGCSPDRSWSRVGQAVRLLKQEGLRVSIDSFDAREVEAACRNGAELVLSVNSTNRAACLGWNAEVVVIPDTPNDEKSFQETIEFLSENGVPMRLDPILEPLGCGFANSLARYMKCRSDYPEAEMLMGIGNITELSDADSAGVNLLLLGICQELGIRSVLTTQVINWSRTSVLECDLARRLVHFSVAQRIPPKHLEPNLVTLRDTRLREYTAEALEALGEQIRDRNIRILNHGGEIHALSRDTHVHDKDPFVVMDLLLGSPVGANIDASHAFYLGYEMAKAHTALMLGKQYTQDDALNWGYLTQEEKPHRIRRTRPPREEDHS